MNDITRTLNLEPILVKAAKGEILSKPEIIFLLSLSTEEELAALFHTARETRARHFSNKLFLYGFVYFSTWCRNDCTFCYFRKSNGLPHRYRKTDQEIVEAAARLAESGVHLIDLTLGEDPFYHHNGDGIHSLAKLVQAVKSQTSLPVMISPGVVSQRGLEEFAQAGADWYACYQETHNRQLFSSLRLKQSYDRRYLSKKHAVGHGLLIEEGILAGVGESLADIADSLEEMRKLGAHQVRVMSFVPQEGSSMSAWPTPDRMKELKIIAIMRLLFPERLIPASLDVDGVEGAQARINAGANVITSLIPPQLGLAGVAQSTKGIDEGHRTVEGILPILERMNLTAATAEEYKAWVDKERASLGLVNLVGEFGGLR